MTFKFAVAAVALALSGAAMAANTSITVTVTDPLDTLPTGFTIPARTVAAGDSFSDRYEFVLDGASDVYGTFVSAKTTFRNVVTKDVMFDSITLSSSAFDGVRTSETVPPDFLFSNLPVGSYTLKITGHATGTLGGSYHGELLAAVPEPEAVAMGLAGMAVVGGMVRRRKSA